MIKLYNFIALILIIYIATMAYWAKELIMVEKNYLEFLLPIGISFIATFILSYTLKRKDRKNNEDEE